MKSLNNVDANELYVMIMENMKSGNIESERADELAKALLNTMEVLDKYQAIKEMITK